MKSPELQETTASEPLTLDEEYEMQQTWLNSEDSKTCYLQQLKPHLIVYLMKYLQS